MYKLEPILAELKKIYSNPTRTYHNMDHINGMLDNLETSKSIATNPYRIELAIWFHDAVYDAEATDNEIKSAELWMRKMPLFLEEEPLEWGKRAILATIDHLPNKDSDIQLLLDLDLASLGAPYKEFKATTAAVRQEYAHISDETFRSGRKAFFRDLLKRARIYGTGFWYKKLEQQTRDNIETALGDR